MRMLLDVNVWIALFDDAHVHSRAANALLARPKLKIATCPMIENAVIRVLNLPGYGRIGPFGLERVRGQLKSTCADLDHEFWPDDISLLDSALLDSARIHGPRQVTDLYLLALAVYHEGRFVTFDTGVTLSAVRGAQKRHLLSL